MPLNLWLPGVLPDCEPSPVPASSPAGKVALNVASVVPFQPPSMAVVEPTGFSGGASKMMADPSPPQSPDSYPFLTDPTRGKAAQALGWTMRTELCASRNTCPAMRPITVLAPCCAPL